MFRQTLRGMFSSIDLFGIPVVINYSGKEKLKTRFGAGCSLIFFAFVAWAFYNSGQPMFERLDPSIVNSITHTEDPRQMILTSNNFPLAIGLQAPATLQYTSFVNPQIFTINATLDSIYITTNANGTSERTIVSQNVDMDICTSDSFGDEDSEFSNLDLSSYYCITNNQQTIDQVSIQGGFYSSVYQTITIDLYQCNSATSTCADEDETKQYLEGAGFNVIFSNMVINPSDYDNPDSRYQDMYSKIVTRSTYQVTTIYLSHLKIETDSGWLFNDVTTNEYVTLDSVAEDFQSKSKTDATTPLISCTFEVSKLEYTYSRSYKKIQAVLAEVAGLANTALLVILIATAPYRKLRFREALMNQLYDVSMDPNAQNRKKKKRKAKRSFELNSLDNLDNDQIMKTSFETPRTKEPPTSMLKEQDSPTREPLHKNSSKPITNSRSEEMKAMSTPKYLKSLDTLTENKQRKNSSQEKTERKKSHAKAYSWREQCEQGTSLNTLNLPTEHKQFSLASIKNERLEGDKVRPRERFTRRNTGKLKNKVVDDIDNDNPDNSLLFPEPGDSPWNHKASEEAQRQEEDLLGITQQNKNPDQDIKAECVVNVDLNEKEAKNSTPISVGEVKNENHKNSKSKETKSEKQVNLKVWEYLLAFFYQPKYLQQKIQIIEDGSQNIDQRLDVVNILKKMREIDKMRAILFDPDQLLLFNNLPKPIIKSKLTDKLARKKTFSHEMLKRTSLIDHMGTRDDVQESYERLKERQHKTIIDKKLLEIFSEDLG